MELSTKTVCIVGPRRLHNEVLADFIRTRLGAASHLSTEIRLEIPQGALLLIDCLGSDRDAVLEKLRSLPSLVERGLLPALFNLNQGLGIEKAALDTGVRGLFFADDSAETLLKCKIRCTLDSKSDLNWTPSPVLTGQQIRFELDTFPGFPDSVSRSFRTKKS